MSILDRRQGVLRPPKADYCGSRIQSVSGNSLDPPTLSLRNCLTVLDMGLIDFVQQTVAPEP